LKNKCTNYRVLRGRSDTIRSIVANLVGEGGDLVEENEQIAPIQTSVEDYSDRNWEPEPIDAGPGKYIVRTFAFCPVKAPKDFRTNKPSDVISTLVSIYDSKDLFVKELQHLLAQRLLAITDGNFDREVRRFSRFWDAFDGLSQRRNIEILKLRFGDAALQVCEVMLKDMTDSRRLNQYMQSQDPVRTLTITGQARLS
jgi:anaphase-promoting complex subunit 2